jgi:hypothetical protein
VSQGEREGLTLIALAYLISRRQVSLVVRVGSRDDVGPRFIATVLGFIVPTGERIGIDAILAEGKKERRGIRIDWVREFV